MKLRQLARRMLGEMLPPQWLLIHGPRSKNCVYLTFDDGPHPEHTPRLLDELERFGIQASFFVVGREAERHPDIVRRIVESGHTLGTHSWDHSAAEACSARSLVEETLRLRDYLEQLTGTTTNLCRPPYGAVSLSKLFRLWGARQSIALWSYDPKDYTCQSGTELQSAISGSAIRAGDIVLLHDSRPAAGEAIPFLAKICRELDYRTEALSTLVPAVTRFTPTDINEHVELGSN